MVYFISKNEFKTLYINTLCEKKQFVFFFLFVSFFSTLFFNSFAFGQSENSTLNDSLPITSSYSLDSTLLPQKTRSNFSVGFRGGITNGRFGITNPEENDKNDPISGSIITVFTNYKIIHY